MNGILNIFKPKGMSSFDVVRVVKKVAKTGKVGHTGTLDPEYVDVRKIAEVFGGGGHIRASGIKIKNMSMEEAKYEILNEIQKEL